MRNMHQELLKEIKPADLPAIEEHQLLRWLATGCQNFPNCVTGECNPGCDLESADATQWGDG